MPGGARTRSSDIVLPSALVLGVAKQNRWGRRRRRATMAEKLAEYRQQLAQVEAAIANDPDNLEWIKLRDDLIEVIELTSEIAETAESAGGSSAIGGGAVPLKKWAVGERCQAIFEQDGQWYNAKIVALSEDGYFVTYLGFGNTAQVRQRHRTARRTDASWALVAQPGSA